jgi:hypothetical protein
MKVRRFDQQTAPMLRKCSNEKADTQQSFERFIDQTYTSSRLLWFPKNHNHFPLAQRRRLQWAKIENGINVFRRSRPIILWVW